MKVNKSVTFTNGQIQWLEPVQLSASTLFRTSTRAFVLREVLATLRKLVPDDYLEFMAGYLQQGLDRFGDDWGYTDLLTVLQAATTLLKPERYLEIGVRRGRSMAVVASAWNSVDLYGFDLWVPGYAGMENPGPEFVAQELRRLGHKGSLKLISGDSKERLPEFFASNPSIHFDLITVDGDHSSAGATADLENVLPHLKLGGVLVLDDIAHPQHKYLADIWRRFFAGNDSFDSVMYSELGYGVAFAVKRRETS